MISNLKIRIKNYKSYLDSGWISLDGKIILTGVDIRGRSNGVGKSSILDALNMFLTEDYLDYSKADITSVINNNAGKKDKLEISVNCNIDDKEFTGIISGKDHLTFYGDEYLYSKFKNELNGSIMTQGLVDNIADFEKRSELDNYIDRFYNTKEIISKLTDFKEQTTTNFNTSIRDLTTKRDDLKSQIFTQSTILARLQGSLDSCKEILGVEEKTLQNSLKTLSGEYMSINTDYVREKSELNAKISIVKKQLQDNNSDALLQKINDFKLDKDAFYKNTIYAKKSDFLTKLSKVVQDACNKEYYSALENNYSAILETDVLSQINEVVGVQFLQGTTGADIFKRLNTDNDKVKTILNNRISRTQVSILEYNVDYANMDGFYIMYRNLDTKIDIKYHIPDFVLNAIKDLLNYDWSEPDTYNFDVRIKECEDKIKSCNISQLNKDLDTYTKELNNLILNEARSKELKSQISSITDLLDKIKTYKDTSNKIEETKKVLDTLNQQLIDVESKLTILQDRLSAFNNLTTSIVKYSMEDLRKEFGTKLSHLATLLVKDIFGFDGEISLDSNGNKTSFKFNEGNGFLSFKRLSGGQLQKIKLSINLAMLLFFYKDRQYIFLDEVFQHLDPASKEDLITYITNNLNIKNILLIQHEDLSFEGFKELKIHRDSSGNTSL